MGPVGGFAGRPGKGEHWTIKNGLKNKYKNKKYLKEKKTVI